MSWIGWRNTRTGNYCEALSQVLLDEFWAYVHIYLDQRSVPDTGEAVHFARLDYQDISRAGLEFIPLYHIPASALSDELDLVVGVTVGARAAARHAVKKEYGDPDISLLGSDEVM